MVELFFTILMLGVLLISWIVAVLTLAFLLIIVIVGYKIKLTDKESSVVANLIGKFVISVVIILVTPSYSNLSKIKQTITKQLFQQYHIKEK